jgi:uncharacterized protein YbjT (DUF2867 family)
MSNESVVLVTGATGNVGRHVVSQLLREGIRVRALARNPASADLPREVEVVRGDLATPESLDAVVNGVDAAFLLWRLPTADTARAVIERLAKHARRIVFLSSSAIRDDVDKQTDVVAKVHADVEYSIENSAQEWTFLRPDGFATNALWWWGAQIRQGDVVRWPYGGAAVAPIHERDIATVAVRALRDGGHQGKKYVLSGPESLTLADQVKTIGVAIGRPLRFEEITPEAARLQLLAVMPQEIVDVLLNVLPRLTAGPAPITAVVKEVTGAPARTFSEWASDHAADFR